MSITAFLCCSFHKKDSKVVDFFRQLLEECGIKVLTAEKEDSPFVLGKIYPKIDKSDMVIGIFSCRNKIEKGFTPSSAVLFEIGYATGKNKAVYGFCEEDIDLKELGLLQYDGGNFPHFNKSNLDYKRKDFKEFITSLQKERDIRGSWEFLQYVKDVTIYNNGYGVVRLRCTLKTRSENFKSVPHMFGLGDSAGKEVILPDFNTIKEGGVSNRWKQKPFFNFRIIDANFDESEVSIIPKECTEEKINFMAQFPKIPINTIFTYEWAWGYQGLFPLKKIDLEPGKRKKDLGYVCSAVPGLGGYRDFIFVLRFEGIPKFIQQPIIKAYDSAGEQITEKVFELQRSALYTNFVANLRLIEIQGGRIEAQWVPQ